MALLTEILATSGLVTKNGVETLNNKTFASPVISGNTDMNGDLDVDGGVNITGDININGAIKSQAVRQKLTGPRTYYVSTAGNDANNGLTAGAPFLTIQKAVNTAAALDNGGFDVTIRLLAGIYTTGFELRSFVGAGKIIVRGDADDSASSVISTTSASCVTSAKSTVGVYRLEYLKLQTTTSGYGIVINGGTNCVEISNINFGACASLHMSVGSGSTINAVGVSYTISGSAPGHVEAADGGVFRNQFSNVTLSGSLNFNQYAYATRQGYMSIYSTTFTGSASAFRYSATNGGGIFVGGAGASYLPGSLAGSVTTTGWYE